MDDQLHPVIHPNQWPDANDYVHRPFFIEDEESPLLVSFATNPKNTQSHLTEKQLEESEKTLVDIEKEAIKYWVNLNQQPAWQEHAFPGSLNNTLAIRGGDDTTSSILLSHGHLKGIHKHFKADNLGLIIPSRGTIIAHPDFLSLAKLGRRLFEEAKERERELSPLCFASYEANVLGYVTPEYEKEHSKNKHLSEPEQIELAVKVIDAALVMIGSKGEEDAETLAPFAEDSETIAAKACQKLLDDKLTSTTELAQKELSQLRLLTFLSQGVYNFDQAAPDVERFKLRKLVKALVAEISSTSGGGTFRMESEAGEHEQSSLEVINGVLS